MSVREAETIKVKRTTKKIAFFSREEVFVFSCIIFRTIFP